MRNRSKRSVNQQSDDIKSTGVGDAASDAAAAAAKQIMSTLKDRMKKLGMDILDYILQPDFNIDWTGDLAQTGDFIARVFNMFAEGICTVQGLEAMSPALLKNANGWTTKGLTALVGNIAESISESLGGDLLANVFSASIRATMAGCMETLVDFGISTL